MEPKIPDSYADLYENAPDLFFSVDAADARIVECNRAACDSMGYRREELVGRPIFDLVHDDWKDAARRLFRQFQKTGVIRNGELVYVRKDGTSVPVSISSTAFRDESGRILRSRSVVRDMTGWKRLEQELEEAHRELQHITSNISDYLWSAEIDENGDSTYRYYSSVVERITGRPPEFYEEGPHKWFGTILPEDQPRLRQVVRELINGERTGAVEEYRILHANGSTRWVRDHVRVQRLPNGHFRLNGVVADITADHETEEEMAAREMELAHVSRLSTLGELIAGIAHEVNQPLSSVSLLAGACEESLRRDKFDREQFLGWIRDIGEQARSCGEIVSRIKNFARKADTDPVLVNVNSLVRDSLKLLTSSARRFGIEVVLDLEEPSPLTHANRLQLQQVVVNLIRNAYDAMRDTPRGRRRVTIRTAAYRGKVEVRIEDVGVGLPQGNVDIFESFYTTKREGLGMGLAICRSIIESHGGTLWVEAHAGAGATARFSLPEASEDDA